jgi:hypothetical protein
MARFGSRAPDLDEEQPDGGAARAPGSVTRLVAQKKNPQRVSIFIDEAYAFGVHQDVMIRHALMKGTFLSTEEQE